MLAGVATRAFDIWQFMPIVIDERAEEWASHVVNPVLFHRRTLSVIAKYSYDEVRVSLFRLVQCEKEVLGHKTELVNKNDGILTGLFNPRPHTVGLIEEFKRHDVWIIASRNDIVDCCFRIGQHCIFHLSRLSLMNLINQSLRFTCSSYPQNQ